MAYYHYTNELDCLHPSQSPGRYGSTAIFGNKWSRGIVKGTLWITPYWGRFAASGSARNSSGWMAGGLQAQPVWVQELSTKHPSDELPKVSTRAIGVDPRDRLPQRQVLLPKASAGR
ncbi:hypothetical protein E2562_024570 [Oryza meyeriana var. granulata]|uniref:Uncharacterized protein n=1 Tax=Oryza meyeriana var. granulata TaxID=110450 RepID=A0A6G1CU32_9ORYZ|nr:hypothetical protein E2562_024570 [Oryza meyeriana var. granulata]